MVAKGIFFKSHNYKARPCLIVSINLALFISPFKSLNYKISF